MGSTLDIPSSQFHLQLANVATVADAISIRQMQRLSVTKALTNDHHFEQAGFTRLLK